MAPIGNLRMDTKFNNDLQKRFINHHHLVHFKLNFLEKKHLRVASVLAICKRVCMIRSIISTYALIILQNFKKYMFNINA